MVREIGVFNVPPIYVLGLCHLSDVDGYSFETVEEPKDWIRLHRDSALLMGIRMRTDVSVVIDITAEAPETVIVTVIDEYDVESVREALVAGASGVVSRDAGAGEVVLALRAALADNTVMPTGLARRLATGGGPCNEPLGIEDLELTWLQSLADRTTVAALGKTVGYSEREMYRRLNALYHKMGVSGRTEALLKASRFGWIR